MPLRTKPLPPVSYVRALLSYDPLTGVFRWRQKSKCIKPGAIAGNLSRSGYRLISIASKNYPAHRLAWLHVYGVDPPLDMIVDHINHNTDDNRISNLRLVTNSQSQCNRTVSRICKSGLKGVHKQNDHVRSKPWTAVIRVNGNVVNLGHFTTKVEAASAYLEAAKKYHGEFACVNYRVINGRLRVLLT